MPHQSTNSTKATAQNAATEPTQPNDQARDEHVTVRPEPRAYAAPDLRDATLAAPAAGEVGDYGDLEDDELDGGAQQGRSNNNREAHADHEHQGPKTQAANRAMAKSGAPDQGTH